jgi:hypothetical protein
MCGDKKHSRIFVVLLLVSVLAFSYSCKKNPTAPQIDDAARPVIWLSQSALSFSTSDTGGNPSSQSLVIKNNGPGTLDYTIESDADWATVSPTAGSSTASQENDHTVSVTKAGLEAKDKAHTAKLTVLCSQAYNNPQQVTVSFLISKGTPPKIWIESQTFTFNAKEGGPDPSPQELRIKNDGEGTLDYELIPDVSWISVNPPTGSTEGAIKVHQVTTQVANLPPGTHNGKITIRGNNAANSPQSIAITLKINKDEPPKIGLSTKNLAFNATQGGSDPPPKSFSVWNTGGGVVKYTVACNAAWLSVNPSSGQTGGAERNHSVFVNIAGLGAGSHQGAIEVSDPNASNTPQKINVSLNITSAPTDNAISVSCNPSSAKTDTIVSFPVKIRGNLAEISVFGLDMTFDTSIFQFHSTAKGALTGGWAAVDGNEISPGTIKIGGFAGSANPIPVSSEGTIVIVKLKVISTSTTNRQTKVWIKNYIDDIQGLLPSSTSTNFTYLK